MNYQPHRRIRGPVNASLADVLPSITDRDRQLLGLLDELEVLTTVQITVLLFGSPTTCTHRLLRLYRRGLLDRFRRYQHPGSQPWHWTLGPLGARLTALAAGRTPPTRTALNRHRDQLAASPRLHHLLGVNQFYTLLAAHTRTHPHCHLTRWWSEQRTVQAFARRVHPDAHGVWVTPEATVGFFVEYDTGAERPISRLTGKLAAYARLVGAGGPAWPVLFWLPSAAREHHLHQHLSHIRTPMPVATAVTGPQAHPAGAVWRLAGTTGARLRLAELPCPAGEAGPLNPGLPDNPGH